jgi:ubiquinone/menaquinone biosynthesis C-methylase UbiE
MTRFGADPNEFFAAVYRDIPPWDVGGPQPAMARLLDDFPPQGPVLDVGCGSGDLALFLARKGLRVTGIDFVPAAIEQARAKAAALPQAVRSVEFMLADASRPSLLGRQFNTVVDSGFYHVLTAEQGADYIDDLTRTLVPGGRLYMHEFATEFDLPNTPRPIADAELRARFTEERGWRIRTVRSGEFLSRVAPVLAILACIERLA